MKDKPSKTKRTPRQMVPIPQDLYDLLKELADEGNRPVSYELKACITEHLKRHGKLPDK